jgi:hypothetical protein
MTGSEVLVAAAVVGILVVAVAWVIVARRRRDFPFAGPDTSADSRREARAQDPLMAAIARSREARGLPPVPRRDPRGSVNAPRAPTSGVPADDGTSFGGPTWVRRLDTTIRVIPTLPPGSEAAGSVGAEAEAGERRSA